METPGEPDEAQHSRPTKRDGQTREERMRQLLWSARNHLQAAQARVEELYEMPDPVTPPGLGPFERQEIAIYTGAAAEHLLLGLLLSSGQPTRRMEDVTGRLKRAEQAFPDVALHSYALRRVNEARNNAIHRGRGPKVAEAIQNFSATEEFASFVNRELRAAGNSVHADFSEFDEYQASEAASRALTAFESEVQSRIRAAAAGYVAKTGGRDADEVTALLELEREGWLRAADPEALYEALECPACGSNAFAILCLERIDSDMGIIEYVRADRFFCVACGLDLEDSEWPFAGITDTFSDPNPELFL